MLLLTSCEVIWQNILTAVLMNDTDEMRTIQKAKVQIFSVLNEQMVNKSFIV